MKILKFALGLSASIAGLAHGQSDKTYIVREGDTLSAIAEKFGVSIAQIERANRLANPDSLKPGQTLRLPREKVARQLPTLLQRIREVAKPGKTPTETHIAESQGSLRVQRAAPTKAKTYTVRPGDNDWIIAARVGTTPKRLREANPGIVWNRLQIGSRLVLPVDASIPRQEAVASIRSPYAKVAKDSVVVRSGPSSETRKVVVVPGGTLVKVLDRSNGWYKLRFPLGTVGWVRGDLLKPANRPRVQVATNLTRRRSSTQATPRRERNRQIESPIVVQRLPDGDGSVLSTAFAMRGTRYRYGASSRSAVDCSGFTRLVYQRHGVSLPHSSRAQANIGTGVPKSQLQKGDLVFFKTNRGTRINHVGIYIGNGQFIHASSGGGRVQVNSLNEGYYAKRFAGARRVKNAR